MTVESKLLLTASVIGAIGLMIGVSFVVNPPPAAAAINVSGSGAASYSLAVDAQAVAMGDLAPVVTTITSVSGAGTLSAIAFRVTTPTSGLCTSKLTITADGNATDVVVWASAFTPVFGAVALPFKTVGAGAGEQAGDAFVLPIHQPFSSSLSVTWTGGACSNVGAGQVSVLRGVRR